MQKRQNVTKGNKNSYAEYRNLQTRCVVTWWHFVNVMLPACCLTLMCCCMVAWSMETTHPVTLSLGGIIKGMPPPCRHLLGVEWSKGCHKIVFLWPCHKVTEWWDSLLLRTSKNANQVWKYSIYSSERTRSKTVSPATDNGQKHMNKIPKLHVWRPYTWLYPNVPNLLSQELLGSWVRRTLDSNANARPMKDLR